MQSYQPDNENIILSDLWLSQSLYHLRMCKSMLEDSMSTASSIGFDEIGNDLQAIMLVETRLTSLSLLNKSAVQREARKYIEQ
jgi:hypothetical protein